MIWSCSRYSFSHNTFVIVDRNFHCFDDERKICLFPLVLTVERKWRYVMWCQTAHPNIRHCWISPNPQLSNVIRDKCFCNY